MGTHGNAVVTSITTWGTAQLSTQRANARKRKEGDKRQTMREMTDWV